MTCIVGLVDKKRIWIGGDSFVTSSKGYSTISNNGKVFRVKDFIFGTCGSVRSGQLLRYSFEPPKIGRKSLMCYMTTDFIDAIRKLFLEGGYAKKENEQEEGGTFMVGYKGRLFIIYSDYQVEELKYKYNSVGSGRNLAMASMATTDGLNWKPEVRIRRALSVAAKFIPSVGPPFIIKSL